MFILVYITCGSKEEARNIAESLVKEKLVACVNYFPTSSIFHWEGKLQREEEYALICKTREKLFAKIQKKVRKIHSYDVPAVISIPILEGNPEFLKWIGSVTEK